jgi:hypothetical protein
MKKLIIAVTCIFYVASLNAQLSQNDFNNEFSRILEMDKKIGPIVKEFREKFSVEQLKVLFEGTSQENVLNLNSIKEARFKELKEGLNLINIANNNLILKLYGSKSNVNLVDLQQRIGNYSTANPTCIGCYGACYSAYFQCKDQGYPEWLCDLDRSLCIAQCHLNGQCPM